MWVTPLVWYRQTYNFLIKVHSFYTLSSADSQRQAHIQCLQRRTTRIPTNITLTHDSTDSDHLLSLAFFHTQCRNPTLAKYGGEAQHLEKLEVGSLPGLPNV